MKAEIKLLHVFKEPVEEPSRIKQTGTFEKYYRDELRIVEEESKEKIHLINCFDKRLWK